MMNIAKIYPAKADHRLILVLVVIFIGTTASSFYYQLNDYATLFVMVFCAYFIFYFKSFYYVIDNENLSIHSGFFCDKIIPINSIHTISETGNPFNSSFWHLNKIKVEYGKGIYVRVVPLNRIEFLQHLVKINPYIGLNFRFNK